MANRSYKSILHNKKELHEEHSTPVEEIKKEQTTEAADTTVEEVSEEKTVEEIKEEQETEAADTPVEEVVEEKTAEEAKEEQATEATDTTVEEKPVEKKCLFSFLKPNENRKKVPFILFSFISLSITMLISEFIFKVIEFGFTLDLSVLRITLFSFGFAGILATILSFFPLKVSRILNTIFCFILPVYALFQIGIHNMMHSYATLKTAGGLAGAMVSYVLQYIRQMPPLYWLMLLIPLFYVWIQRKFFELYQSKNNKNTILVLVSALALDECGLLLTSVYGDWEQYTYPTFQERAVREYGIERFLLRDIATIFTEKEATLQEEEQQYTKVDSTRKIDDTKWTELSNADDNETRKKVDSYLMNQNIEGYNEKTGLLDGKNLIYVMIEAYDYIGMDQVLTPTLYKMMTQGWNFSHHYTPKFDTGTSDSELISETSLVPRRDTNVYAEFADNTWKNSIFSLFNAAGYSTHAYHNWSDEFYPRKEMMESLGCEDYEDWTDFKEEYGEDITIPGWQSDYDLFRFTTDKFINEDKFMTMYITSSTHFPYNTNWDVLGNKYLDEINKVHPDYPEDVKHYISKAMELDKGMEYLLETLEEAGKLDDTAIVFFADHHPLNMNLNYLYDCTPAIDDDGTTINRSEGMNEFRSPLVIYCPSILGDETFTDVTSTYDILPTVLNLYNLNYDPRFYLGTDYFSEQESIVYFPDGDWTTNKGTYYAATNEFVPADESVSVDDSYITNNTARVNNAFNISLMIYQTDYFKYRSEITTPDSSLKNFVIVQDPETGESIQVEATATPETSE